MSSLGRACVLFLFKILVVSIVHNLTIEGLNLESIKVKLEN